MTKPDLTMRTTRNWAEYAKTWGSYTAPARPPQSIQSIYAMHIKKFIKDNTQTPNILILGCTPEYRDVCSRFRCTVTLVDMMPEMKLAMDTLRQQKNNDETFVLSNWLKFRNIPSNHFDFVFGDIVINNINHKDRPRFISNIKKCLKPSGLFISRHIVSLENKKNLEVIMREYEKKKEVNYTELWWDLLLHITHDKTRDIISNDQIGKIDYTVFSKKIQRMMTDYFNFFPPFKAEWSILSEKKQTAQYQKYFFVEQILYKLDYYLGSAAPVYVLRKSV